MQKMTQTRANKLTEPGFYACGDTLYLRINDRGGKSWIQRIVINGQRRDIGLGSFTLVRLAEARDRAYENRRAARIQGRDPLAEKRKADMPVFKDAAYKWFEANKSAWRGKKTAKDWQTSMEMYVFPSIGDMRLDAIGREHVLRILTDLWDSKPQLAQKLRAKIRTVFAWAQAHGYVEINPAGEGITAGLPKVKTHNQHRALPYQDVPAALKAIADSRANMAVKLALRFVVLTAGRSGEIRGASWDEINLTNKLWTIPAGRMKNGREHIVPLSDAAMQVLEQAKVLANKTGLVFPSPRGGKVLADYALADALKAIDLNGTVHGFRSSFRSWAGACTDADHAVMELSLSHAVGDQVERAYARSTLVEKRRGLMEQWADYIV